MAHQVGRTNDNETQLIHSMQNQGLQTLQFLHDNHDQLLQQEAVGANRMHLYLVGALWIAVERSAFLLQSLAPEAIANPVQFEGWQEPLVAASISPKDLAARTDIASANQGRITIATPQLPRSAYANWHRRLTSILR